MSTYSNGSIQINAIKYTGNNLAEVIEFTGKHPRFDEWFPTYEDYEKYVREHDNLFKLFKTDEKYFYVAPGEWIFRDLNGEWWSMADSQFRDIYHEV